MSGRHRVTLEWGDGRTATVGVDPDRTVVDAAEDAGVAVPYGCLTGACATCTGRLVDGDLRHRREPRALKRRHLDAGYVLLCIAEPRSDARVRVGPDVGAELVENPWK